MSHHAEDGRSPYERPDVPAPSYDSAPSYDPAPSHGNQPGYRDPTVQDTPQAFPEAPRYGDPDPYATGPTYPETPAYGVSPYGVNPYQPAYGGQVPYGAVPQPHPRVTIALVLGILGVVLVPPAGIVGLVLGVRARKEIDAEPYRYSGRGTATAAVVLGIVSAVIGLLAILLVLFVILAVASSS
jgi:hypothetical protein